MKMQRHGQPPAAAINTTRSKEIGPAGGGGAAPPTIRGDAANKWKQSQAEVKAAGDRLYLLFDWGPQSRSGSLRLAHWQSPIGFVGLAQRVQTHEVEAAVRYPFLAPVSKLGA